LGAFHSPKILGLVVGDRPGDDDVLALLPVDGRRDPVLGGELERVDHPEDLVEVAAGGHRVDEDELDLLVGPDDEDVADGLVVGRRAGRGVAGGLGRQHPVELGHIEVGVADDRVVGAGALGLLDVVRPPLVVPGRVHGQPDDLHVAPLPLGAQLGHVPQLGGAHGGEVLGVGEEHGPRVADPVVEADPSLGGVGLEVGRGLVDEN
jgi:hypothetical protein